MAILQQIQGQHLGDCNDSLSCYNCGRASHIAQDCQNYQNRGKPGHLAKDFLNYSNCGKPRHFARDCSKQERSNMKHGNARVYVLTQGEVRALLRWW